MNFLLDFNIAFFIKEIDVLNYKKEDFEKGELEEDSVCRKFRYTGSDGKNYNVKIYHLDTIISVGYRVNSF